MNRSVFEHLIKQLRNVHDYLRTEKTVCGECGHHAYEDWKTEQARQAMHGAISRVEKAMRLLDGKEGEETSNDEEG